MNLLGVGYNINKQTSQCFFSSLEPDYDSISLGSNAGGGEQIKDPNQFFYIDNTLIYASSVKSNFKLLSFLIKVIFILFVRLNDVKSKSMSLNQPELTLNHRFSKLNRKIGKSHIFS